MWDHAWAHVASIEGTLLPPPIPILAEGYSFACYSEYPARPQTWIALVGTRWSPTELVERLTGTWIPCLFFNGNLVATCVLRPLRPNQWILETLVSRQKGSADPLIRSAFRFLWDHGGPFSLFFTWELSLLQLVGTWWKGWSKAIRAVRSTWVWTADCFCHHTGLHVNNSRFVLPTVIQPPDHSWSVTVSDSGLEDGWGYVLDFTGSPDWTAVAKRGGWLSLWAYGSRPGSDWGFTSHVVVVGAVNYAGEPPRWITPEIAYS
jgi:hypothetical protein